MNFSLDESTWRISRRLNDALVADLALGDLSADGDRWFDKTLADEDDWSSHLASRQLEMTTHAPAADLHDTMLVLLVVSMRRFALGPRLPSTPTGIAPSLTEA